MQKVLEQICGTLLTSFAPHEGNKANNMHSVFSYTQRSESEFSKFKGEISGKANFLFLLFQIRRSLFVWEVRRLLIPWLLVPKPAYGCGILPSEKTDTSLAACPAQLREIESSPPLSPVPP